MALKTDNESLSLINHQLRLKLKARGPLWQLGDSSLAVGCRKNWGWGKRLIEREAELQIQWTLNPCRSHNPRLGTFIGKNRDHDILAWKHLGQFSLLEKFEMLNLHYSLGLITFNTISACPDVGHIREEGGVRLKSCKQMAKKWIRILIKNIELILLFVIFNAHVR